MKQGAAGIWWVLQSPPATFHSPLPHERHLTPGRRRRTDIIPYQPSRPVPARLIETGIIG